MESEVVGWVEEGTKGKGGTLRTDPAYASAAASAKESRSAPIILLSARWTNKCGWYTAKRRGFSPPPSPHVPRFTLVSPSAFPGPRPPKRLTPCARCWPTGRTDQGCSPWSVVCPRRRDRFVSAPSLGGGFEGPSTRVLEEDVVASQRVAGTSAPRGRYRRRLKGVVSIRTYVRAYLLHQTDRHELIERSGMGEQTRET